MNRLHFRDTDLSGAVVRRYALFSRGDSAGTDTGSNLSSPLAFNAAEVAMVASGFGPAETHTLQFNVAGALVGPTFSVNDATPEQRHLINLDIAALDAGRHLLHRTGTTGATGLVRNCFRYELLSPFQDTSLHGAGDEASNITLAGTDRFLGLNGDSTAEGNVTESAVQVPIPFSATIVFMAVRGSVAAGSAVDLFLRKNGVDTAVQVLGMTNSTSGGYMGQDLTHSAAFAAGDLLSFRYVRSAGAGTSVALGIVVGLRSTV